MNSKLILITLFALILSGCAKMEALIDTPNKMDDMARTTHQMKDGMDSTNEAIRMQKISIALSEMQKPANRMYLSPIPGDMMPAGKVLAESLKAEETVLLFKNYLKKINEEYFENRFPMVDKASKEGQALLADFEHDKMADLMMITIIAGFLPDELVKDLILTESEQGAYQEVLFSILMLRFNFNNDLMLNASVLSEKLITVGKINKAIEYNAKVDAIAKLPFYDLIGIKITGFSDSEMNKSISKKIDRKIALNNWKKIYSHAASDFLTTSFDKDSGVRQNAMQLQKSEYNKSLNRLNNFINSWNDLLPKP